MHSVVIENLEEFLAGTIEPTERQAVERHLSGCTQCCEEVRGMQDVALLFNAFGAREGLDPAPGFYARVMQKVENTQPAPSLASVFALDAIFGRKLVFACLLTLGVLGGYLVSSERTYTSGKTPEAMMAEQSQPAFDQAPASESMLVTLTNYEY